MCVIKNVANNCGQKKKSKECNESNNETNNKCHEETKLILYEFLIMLRCMMHVSVSLIFLNICVIFKRNFHLTQTHTRSLVHSLSHSFTHSLSFIPSSILIYSYLSYISLSFSPLSCPILSVRACVRVLNLWNLKKEKYYIEIKFLHLKRLNQSDPFH